MKKLLLSLIVAVSVSITASAQVTGGDYKGGIGLRLGGGYYDLVAASLKMFPATRSAIELNLGIRPYGAGFGYGYSFTNVSFSGSYQHHFPISNIEGFKWFIGGGATIFHTFSKYDDIKGIGIGIFPTGGVEYKFPQIPLAVSADLRPTFSLTDRISTYDRFYVGNVGIAARYTFR